MTVPTPPPGEQPIPPEGQPQSAYQQPAYGPPMPMAPPPKNNRKRNIIIAAVVGAVVLLCACGGIVTAMSGGDKKDDKGSSSSSSSDKPADGANNDKSGDAVALGQEAKDGKFTFTVTDVDQGKTEVGSQYLNKKAQGEYVIVSLTVKNTGDQAQTFIDDNQKLISADGTQYEADSTASLYLNEDGQGWISEINPGNQVKVKLAFDVPKGTAIDTIELHDSLFSGGVIASLK